MEEKQTFLQHFIVLIVISISLFMLYQGVIIPQAEALLQSGGSQASRHTLVVIKDTEQMFCFIAMIFCTYLILLKIKPILNNQHLYHIDFLAEINTQDKQSIDIEQAINVLENSKFSSAPILQTWVSCLLRYQHTDNVQHASDAVQASVEALAVRLEAGNSMIRYLIWAIPSIGFIGTVRGIGQALAQADQALAGDISGMTNSLGVAFNSTLVALFISIILMLLLHYLQKLQDDVVVKTQAHCERYLLKYLHQ